MPVRLQFLMRSIFTLAFLILLAGFQEARAQNVLTGDWTASVDSKKPDKIELSFERRSEKSDKSQMSSTFNFADLQGLTREQALAGGPAKFSLVREAGTIDCEGSFQNGKGSGTFRFTENQTFRRRRVERHDKFGGRPTLSRPRQT
jgi:hypothetical protein